MDDYISRPEFIASCEGRYCAPCKEQGKDHNGVQCRACWVDDMLGEVLDAPTADMEPVRHGRWKRCFEDWRQQIEGDKCSLCGFEYYGTGISRFHYCPNCGAKMYLEDGTDDN